MAQCTDTNNCIEVNDLKMHFMLKSGLFSKPKVLKAVDGVTFSIEKGRTMGLVGESGCGKTTVGRTILKLYQATAGRILYQGTDITGLSDSQMVPYRKKMQMIFQDPYTSLDPRKNIGDIIAEPIWAMKLHTGKDKNDRVRELIEMVGLKPDHINRYPHEFSGGQRQSPYRPWMYPSRPRLSIYWRSCRISFILPICSFPMICPWCAISRQRWGSCTWAISLSTPRWMSCMTTCSTPIPSP